MALQIEEGDGLGATALDPFLSGNFAPVLEELDATDLPVTGRLPEALSGHYLRNGANPAYAPLGRYHWFDGDGMVHAVHLDGGRARSYRNRWVRTAGLEAERAAGRALFGGINHFVFPEPVVMAAMGGPFKNAANTSVIRHHGKVLALWEGGFPHELDVDLGTVGLYDFCGGLQGAMTAHPKIDPVTGEMLFFGYSQFPPYLRFHVADATGRLVRTEEIDLPRGVMIHDFVVTERHAVFLDAPAVFDFDAVATGGPGVRWAPEHGARLGVLPRDPAGGGVRWYEVDPCFVFHFMNAYVDGESIVVDAARHPRLSMPGDVAGEHTSEPTGGSALARFTLDLSTGRVSNTQLDDRVVEFPRIDDRRTGLRHRYGITPAASEGMLFDQLVRYDLERGTEEVHRFPGGQATGEAVFAADPDHDDEDAGWYLAFTYDPERQASDLVILDAQDLAGDPVASVHLPQRVPFGFHGSWMPAEG